MTESQKLPDQGERAARPAQRAKLSAVETLTDDQRIELDTLTVEYEDTERRWRDAALAENAESETHTTATVDSETRERLALRSRCTLGGVLLALDTLAAGKDVVVSRGELVEIGDSFRIPDILKKSGARLVEVGTTNRTRLDDYRRAITGSQGEVGALLKVHQSNFRIVGFTEAASTADLVALGAEFGIPVIEDFGSGNLQPLTELGVDGAGNEPTLADRVASGADLVIFSGDKLFGGPQAGILLGTAEVIRACRKNPLARALRPDKMAIAGLQATLWSHLTGRARREVPVIRAIARPLEEIEAVAERLRAALAPAGGWQVEVVVETSRIGGRPAPDSGGLHNHFDLPAAPSRSSSTGIWSAAPIRRPPP